MGRGLLEALLGFAREGHPREVIVLLRGRAERGVIHVSDFLLPPFGLGGRGFAQFPVHMLPIDFTIMGTAHSHPSGALRPSAADLNNFYGRVMMIMARPYTLRDAAFFNSRGEQVPLVLEK